MEPNACPNCGSVTKPCMCEDNQGWWDDFNAGIWVGKEIKVEVDTNKSLADLFEQTFKPATTWVLPMTEEEALFLHKQTPKTYTPKTYTYTLELPLTPEEQRRRKLATILNQLGDTDGTDD